MQTLRRTVAVLIFPAIAWLGAACERTDTPTGGRLLASLAGPARLLVDDDLVQCPTAQFTSIQAAVTAAQPGDHIDVCPGTYMEQVIIPAGKDNIRLRSTQRWQAIVKAPPDNPLDPIKAIVRVNGALGVTILAFTITGPGSGLCNSLRYGVRVDNGGSADILGNHITDIRDALPPPSVSGCQNGVAILVGRWVEGTSGSARIIGNVIENYQKNGPTVDNVGSYAEIANNRILGVGPTATIAQNGIQVSRRATGDIRHNFIAGHVYTLPTDASTGMIFFGPGAVRTDHNTLTSNDVGVYMDNNATPPSGPGCGTPGGSSACRRSVSICFSSRSEAPVAFRESLSIWSTTRSMISVAFTDSRSAAPRLRSDSPSSRSPTALVDRGSDSITCCA